MSLGHVVLCVAFLIITLCAYVQQGYYAFGLVSLCICDMPVCVCTVYVCGQKKRLFGVLPLEKFSKLMYCLLVEYNCQKGAHYTRQFVQGKKFRSILLAGQEKGSGKLYHGIIT